MSYREPLYRKYHSISEHRNAFSPLEEKRSERVYAMIVKRFFPRNKSAKIIDLGCGSGGLVSYAHNDGYKAIEGVDGSEEEVSVAHKRGRTNVSLNDITSFLRGCKDESVDLITSFDVIEHLDRDELLTLSVEIFRVLKGRGYWVLHTVNAASPFSGDIRYGDLTHEQAFTFTSIKQLALYTGFGTVKIFESAVPAHGLLSLVRKVVWKVVVFFFTVAHAAETGNLSFRLVWTRNFYAVLSKTTKLDV